jgi:hypothetical protein
MSALEIGNIALVLEVVQAVPRPSVRLGSFLVERLPQAV